MKPNFFFPIFIAAYLLLGIPLAGLASSIELYCSNSNTVINSSDPVDLLVVCQAVSDARDFLGSYGLEVGETIDIQIIEEIPKGRSVHMLGYYDHNKKRLVRKIRG